MLVHGPPASGKTILCERVCKHYNLHHITLHGVLNQAVGELERRYLSELDDDQSDDEDNEDKNLVRRIQSVREEARDRAEDVPLEDVLDEHQITRFMKERLLSMQCQNQGFVLDGYPKTYDQARDLFAVEDGEESTVEEARTEYTDPIITPKHVWVLDAQDQFLKDRVLHLPEIKLMQTYRSDSAYGRLLAEYRDANQEDKSVLTVFGDDDADIEHIDVTRDKSGDMQRTLNKILDDLGDKTAMEATESEQYDQLIVEMAGEMKKLTDEEALKIRQQAEKEEQLKMEEQQKLLAYEKSVQDEMDILNDLSLPLRNYLITFVLPTLIKGLADTCTHRPSPETCIDYLAEYLFKHNPQIGYEFPGPLPWHEEDEIEESEPDVELQTETTRTELETDATQISSTAIEP